MDERSENGARIFRSVREWNEWRNREPSNFPDLTGTVFSRSYLKGANFKGCILNDAQFLGATVDDAAFDGASLEGCTFIRVDLSHCEGLDLVNRPDTITLDGWTLNRSRGFIPRVLLQRAGLEGDLLTYLAAPSGYQSCFVSYSSSDSTFVDILTDKLAHRGLDLWRDVTHLEPGVPLISTFTKEAGKADRLLAVLSEKALASTWTSLERFSAERPESILPVTLDQAYLDSIDPTIRALKNHKVLSFENWTRGNVLEDGVQILLRSLRRPGAGTPNEQGHGETADF